MFQSKKPKSLRGIHHVREFHLHTNASLKKQCSRSLSTQLPCVIAECNIHHGLVMDGWSFDQNQLNFLY